MKTLSELSSQFGVHPILIGQWKRKLMAGASGVFAKGGQGMRSSEEITAPLYEEIGRLKVEMDWLKKKL